MKKWIGLLTALMLSATALNAVCAKKQNITDFSLLQLNLWVECTKYPNAVRYPGFTFPADNASATPQQLSWAIEADERERIDFVYYHPDKRIRVKAAQIVGPRGCIVRGERLTEFSRDLFILPVNNHWPSDHKGVFVTFRIRH